MTFHVLDSGKRAQFASGMVRDTNEGKARFDLLMPLGVPFGDQFFTRVANHLAAGAVKYDARNWEQAAGDEEIARFKESAFRHFVQWISGDRTEDHAAAVVFNLLAAETTLYKMTNQDD